MGAESGRAKRGMMTETGMPKSQLKDFAKKPKRKMVRGAGHAKAAKAMPMHERHMMDAKHRVRTRKIARAKAALGDSTF